MSPTTPHEPTVCIDTPLPPGYKFVRKGNVYITKNCRKLTHEAGCQVYLVEDKRGKLQGIRVPQSTYNQVLQLNTTTKDARAQAVLKKDLALETKVKAEVLRLYPKIPLDRAEVILKHTLKKRSGRVGRNKDIATREMVDLAVRAYIRHKCTGYDALMGKGVSREKARDIVRHDIDKKVAAWGGEAEVNGTQRRRPKLLKSKTAKQSQKRSSRTAKKSPANNKRKEVSVSESTALLDKSNRPRRKSLRLSQLQERDVSKAFDFVDLT